jgi:hypothetical protein
MITVWIDPLLVACLLIFSVGRVSNMTASTLWWIASANMVSMSMIEAILLSQQMPV